MPVLFMLLQVGIAQHHHTIELSGNDEESLNFLPTAFCLDLVKHDVLPCFTTVVLLSSAFRPWVCNSDRFHFPVAVPVSDPPQSRAPPTSLLFAKWNC